MYDLAVLGGGPGGYVAAGRAGARGLKVVLFEKNELGGVCLNEGCIPTKTLLYSAKMYDHSVGSGKYGVTSESTSFDFGKIMDRKKKVVRKLVGGVKLSMKNNNVEVIKSEAFIVGRGEDGIIRITSDGQEYLAANLLVCTGSEAFVPPIPGLKESGDVIMTNREALSLQEMPSDVVIIGGGVIGMEFASFFNSLGAEVTVIEMLPKILGPMDNEISSMLLAAYEKKKVNFKLGCKVVAIEGNEVVFQTPDGETQRAKGDRILVSVGRRANVTGFGLENLGVEVKRGIVVDSKMRTSVPGVYAAGDVTGFSMLAHTASREGEVAVNTMLGIEDAMSYKAIPGIVYTNPEVAGVGMTEEEAASSGVEYEVAKLPMAFSGRFVAENEGGNGICKIIFDKGDRRILGMHMIGNPCSEIIQSACLAIEAGMDAEQLKKVVFPHPTVSEIIKETVFSL